MLPAIGSPITLYIHFLFFYLMSSPKKRAQSALPMEKLVSILFIAALAIILIVWIIWQTSRKFQPG